MTLCHSDMKLSAGVMHVNDVPWIMSISKNIHYRTASAADNFKFANLELELPNAERVCTVQCLNIVLITLDIQFKSLKNRNKLGLVINIINRGKNFSVIE